MNLLEETLMDIASSGHTEEDVVAVVAWLAGCTWNEFKEMANISYDNGDREQEINENLKIVFSDGSWLYRHECDGYVWWKHIACPNISYEYKLEKHMLTN